GGIHFEDIPFAQQIKYQVETAIDECHLIVWVVDGQTRLVQEEFEIAKNIHKKKKNVIIAVNKIDNIQLQENIYDFYSLGFNNIISISTKHGIGIGNLLDKIISYYPSENKKIKEKTKDLKFCLVGRPNVGKSTLTNALLFKERMIVSNIPGTTTDVVDTFFEKDNQNYRIIDTAGLKKRGSITEKKDKYSFLRTLNAIESCDIVCFLLDSTQEIVDQDRNIAAIIFNYAKPCIIIYNKWDLIDADEKDIKKFESILKKEFKFLKYAPIVFLSAKTRNRIHTLFLVLKEVFANYNRKFSASLLNDILNEAIQINPPSFFNKGKAKFYYLKQTMVQPPEFLCLVNNPLFIHFSYERFLKNQLRLNLELKGIPLKIKFKKKEIYL
ncbi:MAG: ribosome biogenesis GTPase Der, partial [Candidatus Phytoplasma stylosanthis]